MTRARLGGRAYSFGMNLVPTMNVPPLKLEMLHGQPWDSRELSAKLTLLIVYRGYHCPLCKSYLREFHSLQNDLNNLGVQLLAVSADSRERAERARDEWALAHLAIGYGLTDQDMRRWGLFVSQSIKDTEPKLFAEPALFLIQSSSKLFYASYNSMPFARPRPKDILEMIEFCQKEDYPPRGEVRQAVLAANL